MADGRRRPLVVQPVWLFVLGTAGLGLCLACNDSADPASASASTPASSPATTATPASTPAATPTTTIVIDRATQDRLAAQLAKRLGREPTEQERAAVIESYVDGELLYREGLARGLHLDDDVVRRRVIQKMEAQLVDLEQIEPPDDATLQQFITEHPERYSGPARFDFAFITLTRTPKDTDDQRAQRALERLRAGADAASVAGDHQSGEQMTGAQLGQTYGMELSAAISELPVGEWGLVPSAKGWTLAHKSAEHPGDVLPLDQVRGRVAKDWTQAQRKVLVRRQLDALRQKVRVQLAP